MGYARRWLEATLGGESGMALPIALWATVAAFALVSAAMMASITTQSGTAVDSDRKEAIANADAGASIALLRQNKMLTSGTYACAGNATPSGGWCPPQSDPGGKWTYQVSAPTVTVENGETTNRITIVAWGTSGNTTRRVAVSSRLIDGQDVFGTDRAIGREYVRLEGNPHIEVDTGSNGDVTMGGSSTICGDIRHGVGHGVNGSGQCAGYTVTEENRDLPPLSEEKYAQLEAQNDNYRLRRCVSPNNPAGCQLDTYTGQRTAARPWAECRQGTTTCSSPYQLGGQTIEIPGNEVLTIGGGDYFVCRLIIQGHLVMAAGAHSRIFFRKPEHCGMSDGDSQLVMGGNASITASAYNAEANVFDMPGLYFYGSEDIQTYVELAGNPGTTNEVFIYAPWSDIRLRGDSTWIGAMAGNSISMSGNPTITADGDMLIPQLDIPPAYVRERYVECVGDGGATGPSESC